jgi:two-component system copper resistance phosphate regulon response regulator CusR
MRILIVEDEGRLVELMTTAFQGSGFSVVAVGNGDEGLRLALGGGFDLVVLDIGLPGRDGWSVLEELKRQRVTTPVLVLTDQGDIADRVKGFDLGADDYLPKPFDFRELLARARAVCQRATARGSTLAAADVELDLDTRRATRAGKPLDLSPHEFLALLLLVRKNGEVVTRAELSREVLQRKHLGNSNAVEVLIRRLRLKVDDGFACELVRTVRGKGYSFDQSSHGPGDK